MATVLVGLALDACGGQQYDALTLRVQVAEPRHSLGIGGTMAYALGPTVDTARPPITTWQTPDTLRLLLRWPADLGARWLIFSLRYSATSFGGSRSECEVFFRSDTLRFFASGTAAR